jgi:hypothetical protein
MENEEGSKFCQSCGANMSEAAGEGATQSAPPPPPPPPSGGAPPPPPPPRPAASPGAGSAEIDWGWIGTAFNEVFSDIGAYILMGLVVGIVSSIGFILGGPLMGGSLYVIRRKLRGQGKVDIGEIFNVGFAKFGPTFIFGFGTVLIVGIVIGVLNLIPVLGQIVSIVVGAFIGPFLVIGLHYIMEENAEFMDAATKSWNMMSKNLLMIGIFGLVTAIIEGIGGIACGVGVFVTIPVALVMYSLMLESWFPKR